MEPENSSMMLSNPVSTIVALQTKMSALRSLFLRWKRMLASTQRAKWMRANTIWGRQGEQRTQMPTATACMPKWDRYHYLNLLLVAQNYCIAELVPWENTSSCWLSAAWRHPAWLSWESRLPQLHIRWGVLLQNMQASRITMYMTPRATIYEYITQRQVMVLLPSVNRKGLQKFKYHITDCTLNTKYYHGMFIITQAHNRIFSNNQSKGSEVISSINFLSFMSGKDPVWVEGNRLIARENVWPFFASVYDIFYYKRQQKMLSSFGGNYTSGKGKKAEKISIYFDDTIRSKKVMKISLFPWIRIDELKKLLAQTKFQNHLSGNDIRLFYKNLELTPDNRRFFDFGVEPDSIIVIKNMDTERNIELGIINPYHIFDVTPVAITNLIMDVQSGLNNGKRPRLADEGTSGTYFLENHLKKIVAIFKPFDEEPFAQNNPRNYVGRTGSPGIRKGILSGESATRQVAAFLLDQQRFHGVPETTFVEFFHPSFIKKQQILQPIASSLQVKLNRENQLKTKHGSLQVFVESNDIAGNMGSNQFDPEQVHKVAILDIRILNCDRNDANILVKKYSVVTKDKTKKVTKLIPIDHGLCFPDNFQIYDYELVWMGYRQAKQPFSEKSLKFIEAIDPIRDCKKLKERLGFRQICLRNFRIAQTFLKKMAKEGFSLYQIGRSMYRRDEDASDSEQDSEKQSKPKPKEHKSQLQKLISHAENIYFLIKENGIKSTVNFQIMFAKPRKLEQSLPDLVYHSQENNKHEQAKDTSLEKEANKKQSKGSSKREKRIENPSASPSRIRNVSLPNLGLTRKFDRKQREKKRIKPRQQQEDKRFFKKKKQEEWDEVFFHYFEQFLDRFIIEKRKKSRIIHSRSRLMSQNIDYQF